MKMEVELTDEQAKKVEILKEKGISIGEAIDILFDTNKQFVDMRISRATKEKAELEEKISELDEELTLFNKLKDSTMDSAQKQKIVEKEYGTITKTYDESLQNAKHKFKWSKFSI